MRLRVMTMNPAAMSSMLMIGVASLMAPTVHADEGLESSLAVLELYVGDGEYAKTPDYAVRVTESIAEMGKFAVLSRSDTASQVSKSVTSSGRRDTEDKLKQIEQARDGSWYDLLDRLRKSQGTTPDIPKVQKL